MDRRHLARREMKRTTKQPEKPKDFIAMYDRQDKLINVIYLQHWLLIDCTATETRPTYYLPVGSALIVLIARSTLPFLLYYCSDS
jgi:hypothetical protein